MKKIIAISINTCWNVYNFRLGLLKALQDDGYNIVAISPVDEYVLELEKIGIKHYNIKINNKGTNPLEDIKLIFDFYTIYKKIAPDVILHYTIKPNIYGSIAAGIIGIPVISNISGLGTVFLNNKLSSKIAHLLYKLSLTIPKKVFFQNLDDKKLFIDLNLVKVVKTDVLAGSGIDVEKFKPLKQIPINKNTLNFLLIARLVRDKGILEYVDAARILKKRYSHVKFSILGTYYSGNPTAITKEEIKVFEDEGVINYIGTSDDVKYVINKYDCIVLPSYREGLSRVLLEAASMAKPIVTTNVPGCRDVIDDGITGYLCNVKDVDSLVNQIEKIILLSYDQRKKMGAKGRLKVMLEFDEKLVIDKYKSAILEIIK